MNAGLLDRVVDIEQEVVTNTDGSVSKTWTKLFSNRPAWVRPERGNEAMQGQRMEAISRTIFQRRFDSRITPQMRILYNGNYYNIETVIEINRRQYIQAIGRLNT
jgi:SPP1 family predicted phage head-tail adaptor